MHGKALDRAEEMALAMAALDEAAGARSALVSLSVDAAAPAEGPQRLAAAARIVRETRTLMFLEAEITAPEGQITLVLSAVYRRTA